MKRIVLILATLIVISNKSMSQAGIVTQSDPSDTTAVNNLLQQSTDQRNNDPEKSMTLASQAKELAENIDFKKGAAYAYKNIGLAYLVQGKYIEALQNYQESLKIFEAIQFDEGIANLLGNIGVIYYYQSDNIKALDYYLKSLKIAERTGNKLRIMSMLNNVGAIYGLKKATYDKALQYYLLALPLCEQLGDKDALGGICVNVGDIYLDQNNYAKALGYFNKALKTYSTNSEGLPNAYNAIGKLYLKQGNYTLALYNHNKALEEAQKVNGKLNIVPSYVGLANVYVKENDYRSALGFYKKAEETAVELGVSSLLSEIYQQMAIAYAKTSDHANAFKYQSLYANVKDTLYNIETDKKLASRQFDFDLQKKQGEINLLTKDKSLKEAELEKQKLVKNALSVGLVLVFFIAFIIFRNYKAKVRINKILDHQKDQIEHLLLNILPVEVARELQNSGQATPRNYDSVSVLFTDFKSFTSIADKMSPAELVNELNICFMAFDDIIEKHHLEKIKTIGDSYMCAGGIPTPGEDHTHNIVRAGLEIQEYIFFNNARRAEKGLPPWDARIGVHVGPLVAGVVGKKKYAYDIWGSTVNIASRMESNGEPGQVNISAAVYDRIKDEYSCKYRGKIYAKNVGEIDMYFIDQRIESIKVEAPFHAIEEKGNLAEPEKSTEKFDIDTLYG